MNYDVMKGTAGITRDYAQNVGEVHEKQNGRIEQAENVLKNINIRTISSIPHDEKNENQANEKFLNSQIYSIQQASKQGVKTGIEFRPGVDPALSLQLIYKLHSVVHLWKVGKHTYEPATRVRSKWKKFKEDAKEFFKTLEILLPWTEGDIPTRKGNCNILVIAPHGHHKNDEKTYEIARQMADYLNCYAVVNKLYRKPPYLRDENKKIVIDDKTGKPVREKPNKAKKWVDLNRVNQSKKYLRKKYVERLQLYVTQIIKDHGKSFLFWIHGIDDDNIINAVGKEKLEHTDIVIGIGQGYPDELTADMELVDKLEKLLKPNVGIALAERGSDYCGWHPNIMNQFFKGEGYDLSTVQSVQLEIRKIGFRDYDENIKKTSNILSNALSEVVGLKIQDAQLTKVVAEAFEYLKEIFKRHFHEAMLEAGQYLIEKFYGNVEYARNNKKPLLPLIRKLQANSDKVPSKTWVYDAVKLAIDEHDFKDFRTYGNLGHSQKVLLTHVDSDQRKRELVEEAVEGNYTVVKLRERIRDIKGKKSLLSHDKLPKIDELKKLGPSQLIDLKEAVQNRINKLFDELNHYQKRLEKISSVINQKEMVKETNQKAKRGFRDWTEPENNINFCTGCENNCVYCYAKSMAYRRGQVKEGHWHDMIIRQNDVDKKRKLHHGIVGFPSTHDILPNNIEAYLIVLGKLLRAGNEVLIVSKPRIECIKRICEAVQFFKDKVLFRFTIGAMNDDILSFWEPNAPKYHERKECLEYALNMGFRTSVSMEPMLDSTNIEALVNDLSPFVSEDIWLGTMNHLSWIKKGADKRLLDELAILVAGQTPDRLLTIDTIYGNNPKIKWKTEALKIIKLAKESQKNSLLN